MKKIILSALVVLLFLSCGKKGDPYPKKSLHDSVGSQTSGKR